MDPISIIGLVGACIAIAKNSKDLIKGIADFANRLGSAPTKLQVIRALVVSTRSDVRRIRRYLETSGEELTEQDRESLHETLKACDMLLEGLNCTVSGLNETEGIRFKQRAQLVMNEKTIDRYQSGIVDQLTLLVRQFEIIHITNPDARTSARKDVQFRHLVKAAVGSSSSICEVLSSFEVKKPLPPTGNAHKRASSEAGDSGYGGSTASRTTNQSQTPQNVPPSLQGLPPRRSSQNRFSTFALWQLPHRVRRSRQPSGRGDGDDDRSSSSSDENDDKDLSRRSGLKENGPNNDDDDRDTIVPDDSISVVNTNTSNSVNNLPRLPDQMEQTAESSIIPTRIPADLPAYQSLEDIPFDFNDSFVDSWLPDKWWFHGPPSSDNRPFGQTDVEFARSQQRWMVDELGQLISSLQRTLRKGRYRGNKDAMQLDYALENIYQRALPALRVADVQANIQHRDSLLHHAAQHLKWHDLFRLVDAGADVNALCLSGKTPLHRINYNGASDIVVLMVRKLLDANANPNTGRRWGERDTPLHCVAGAREAQLEAIELLISHGANVNAKNMFGHTPLRSAAGTSSWQKATVLNLLLANGARPSETGNCVQTALDVCIYCLYYQERYLCERIVASDVRVSKLYPICRQVRANIEALTALVDHSNEIELSRGGFARALLPHSCFLRGVRDMDQLPIMSVRRQLHALQVRVTLLADEDLYQEVKCHRQTVVARI